MFVNKKIGILTVLILFCSCGEPERSNPAGEQTNHSLLKKRLEPISFHFADAKDATGKAIGLLEKRLALLLAKPQPSTARLGQAYGALGKAYHGQNLLPEALPCYRNARRLAPDTYEWPYFLATIHLELANLDKAEAFFEECLRKNPSYTPAVVNLANLHFENQNPDQAKAFFEHALKQKPRSIQAQHGLARCLLQEGNLDQAIAIWEAIQASTPALAPVCTQLRVAYRKKGLFDLAKSLSAEPCGKKFPLQDRLMASLETIKTGQARSRQGMAHLKNGDFLKARLVFEELVISFPQIVHYHTALGRSLFGMKQWGLAENAFQGALAIEPNNSRGNHYLGTIKLLRGELESAKVYLETSLATDPNQSDTLLNLAKCLGRMGQYDQAVEHLANGKRLDPGNGDIAYWHVFSQLRLGQFSKARALLERANLAFPNHEALTLLHARFLATCPDKAYRDGALAYQFLQAPMSSKNGATREMVLAMAAAAKGDFELAITHQKAALKLVKTWGQPTVEQKVLDLMANYQKGQLCEDLFWFEDLAKP